MRQRLTVVLSQAQSKSPVPKSPTRVLSAPTTAILMARSPNVVTDPGRWGTDARGTTRPWMTGGHRVRHVNLTIRVFGGDRYLRS